MTSKDQALERVTNLIAAGEEVLATYSPSGVIGGTNLDSRKSAGWRTRALTFLDELYGESGRYHKEFLDKTENFAYQYYVESGIGILEAVKQDIEDGYAPSTGS